MQQIQQIHKYTNTLKHKYTSTQIHKYTNTQINQYENTPILKYTYTQIHIYTTTQMHKYRNTEIPIYIYTNTQLRKYKYTRTCSIHNNTNTHSANTQTDKYTDKKLPTFRNAQKHTKKTAIQQIQELHK